MSRREEMILVIDDDEATRRLMAKILDRAGYRCIVAGNVNDARERMGEEDFDLIVADMYMPGGSGLDLLTLLASGSDPIPVIIVTGRDDPDLADTALELGAYGYVMKPFEANELRIHVQSALFRRRAERESRNQRQRLEQMVKDRTDELLRYIAQLEKAEIELRELQDETIRRLSLAAEFRDDDTRRHVERMSRYCSLLATRAGLAPEDAETIRVASSLHDVGKIGVPDSILMKAGSLSESEWEVMKRHCEIGHRLLSGTTLPILNLAAQIALTHHERVDGTGYPQGLSGEEIPIEGRIAAIADVFDALTSNRVYSRAKPFNEGVRILREGRGTQFDADLVDLFLSDVGPVLGIKERYADTAAEDPVELEDEMWRG